MTVLNLATKKYIFLILVIYISDPHICHQDKKIGSCTSFVRKWYFNKEEQKCEEFDFGGCGANGNNFDSESTCMKKCSEYTFVYVSVI